MSGEYRLTPARRTTARPESVQRGRVRFAGDENTGSLPTTIDVRVRYTPGDGWEALLLRDGATLHGPFGKGATAGLAVATLIEVAAHIVWDQK